MKESYGRKIQKIAKVLMIITCVCWGILGIFIMIKGIQSVAVLSYIGSSNTGSVVLYIFLGLLVIGVGIFFTYFVYLLIMAFGRMAENSDLIVKKLGAEELRDQSVQVAQPIINNTQYADPTMKDAKKDRKVPAFHFKIDDSTADTSSEKSNGKEVKTDNQQETRVCSKCGAPVIGDVKFCFKCGTPL